jgi:hypothetical protein
MTDLSPSAKAVLNAFFDADDSRVINGCDWEQDQEGMVAACLRTLADRVAISFFEGNEPEPDLIVKEEVFKKIRNQILAIAEEIADL